jgi:hypothetical protein
MRDSRINEAWEAYSAASKRGAEVLAQLRFALDSYEVRTADVINALEEFEGLEIALTAAPRL